MSVSRPEAISEMAPSTATLVESSVDVAPARRLRIAAIVDSLDMPRWVSQILERLQSSDHAELVLLAYKTSAVSSREDSQAFAGSSLFRLWSKLDYRFLRTRTDDPDACEIVRFQPERDGIALNCADQDPHSKISEVTATGSETIDLVMDFTNSSELKAGNSAEFGLWSFGAPTEVMPALFLEMCEGRNEIEAGVQVRRGQDETLDSIRFSTDLSLFRNYNRYRWCQVDATIRAIARLQRFGWDETKHKLPLISAHTPGNMQTASFLCRSAMRASETVLKRNFYREDWFIGYRATRPVLQPDTISEFVLMKPPHDRFYADPFIVEKNGRTFIFFEDFSLSKKRAGISVIEVDAAGNPSDPQTALEEDYHLSFPCVFEWEGEMYMVPESKGNHTVDLYRATEFPYKWREEKALMEGIDTVDSILLQYGGKFWMFTSGFNQSGRFFRGDNELFVFFSDTPFGPWQPHPKNPVVSDVRRSRSAGMIFVENGQLIRPSQDCAQRYGRAVSLNRIDRLSEDDYAESPVATIGPDWLPGNIGTHTFNQSSKYQVIDGRPLISRFVPKSSRPGPRIVRMRGSVPLVTISADHS